MRHVGIFKVVNQSCSFIWLYNVATAHWHTRRGVSLPWTWGEFGMPIWRNDFTRIKSWVHKPWFAFLHQQYDSTAPQCAAEAPVGPSIDLQKVQPPCHLNPYNALVGGHLFDFPGGTCLHVSASSCLPLKEVVSCVSILFCLKDVGESTRAAILNASCRHLIAFSLLNEKSDWCIFGTAWIIHVNWPYTAGKQGRWPFYEVRRWFLMKWWVLVAW